MSISSGYGIFFNRRIKELKFDRWTSGKSSKLWHNSDFTDADPQINWLVLLGERADTSKLSGQYTFRIYSFIYSSYSHSSCEYYVYQIAELKDRWLTTLIHNDESLRAESISHTKSIE